MGAAKKAGKRGWESGLFKDQQLINLDAISRESLGGLRGCPKRAFRAVQGGGPVQFQSTGGGGVSGLERVRRRALGSLLAVHAQAVGRSWFIWPRGNMQIRVFLVVGQQGLP